MNMRSSCCKYVTLSLFLILSVAFFSCRRSGNQQQKELVLQKKASQKAPEKTLYGIKVDSLLVKKGLVKRRQHLSDIMLNYGVRYATIDYLARHTKKVFDVRQIRRGHAYAVISKKDSVQTPVWFAYEISPSHYVLYHLQDSIYAMLGTKPVVRKQVESKGSIQSSLWNAMLQQHDDPNLAISLSEIYAWTIDFFELRKGDQYKAIYQKIYVDNKYVGMGSVEAADFIQRGQHHYAFYFEQNGQAGYFDENGKSLERTFLKAPLKYRRISSRFSNHRWHPILKIYRPHHGVDYAAAEGTPVHALGDGVIVKRGYQRNGAGNYLKIRHNSVYTTQYAHLRAFAKGMVVGKHVRQGQLIGFVGHTGLATGPHLDFRIYKYGTPVNPLTIKSPSAKPVPPRYRPAFDSVVRHFKPMLDSL
jgi:murein DD-endopeptidase MepM/ murein hydrolase activator NlpD